MPKLSSTTKMSAVYVTYLLDRYGQTYETERKTKSQLFFTINFEASKWLVKGESIMMMVFSHADEVLGLTLLYRRTGG